MRLVLILSFASLLLAGCVSMSAEECRTSNWFDIGYRDGLAGLQWMTDVIYDDQCSKHGVAINADEYRKGWQDGKWEYDKRAIRDSTD